LESKQTEPFGLESVKFDAQIIQKCQKMVGMSVKAESVKKTTSREPGGS